MNKKSILCLLFFLSLWIQISKCDSNYGNYILNYNFESSFEHNRNKVLHSSRSHQKNRYPSFGLISNEILEESRKNSVGKFYKSETPIKFLRNLISKESSYLKPSKSTTNVADISSFKNKFVVEIKMEFRENHHNDNSHLYLKDSENFCLFCLFKKNSSKKNLCTDLDLGIVWHHNFINFMVKTLDVSNHCKTMNLETMMSPAIYENGKVISLEFEYDGDLGRKIIYLNGIKQIENTSNDVKGGLSLFDNMHDLFIGLFKEGNFNFSSNDNKKEKMHSSSFLKVKSATLFHGDLKTKRLHDTKQFENNIGSHSISFEKLSHHDGNLQLEKCSPFDFTCLSKYEKRIPKMSEHFSNPQKKLDISTSSMNTNLIKIKGAKLKYNGSKDIEKNPFSDKSLYYIEIKIEDLPSNILFQEATFKSCYNNPENKKVSTSTPQIIQTIPENNKSPLKISRILLFTSLERIKECTVPLKDHNKGMNDKELVYEALISEQFVELFFKSNSSSSSPSSIINYEIPIEIDVKLYNIHKTNENRDHLSIISSNNFKKRKLSNSIHVETRLVDNFLNQESITNNDGFNRLNLIYETCYDWFDRESGVVNHLKSMESIDSNTIYNQKGSIFGNTKMEMSILKPLSFQFSKDTFSFKSCFHWMIHNKPMMIMQNKISFKEPLSLNKRILFKFTNEKDGKEILNDSAKHFEIHSGIFFSKSNPKIDIGITNPDKSSNAIANSGVNYFKSPSLSNIIKSLDSIDLIGNQNEMKDKVLKICLYNDKNMIFPYKKLTKNQRVYFKLELIYVRESELYQCYYHHSCEIPRMTLQLNTLGLCHSKYDAINKLNQATWKMDKNKDCLDGSGDLKRIYDFSDPNHHIIDENFSPEIYPQNCGSKILGSFLDVSNDPSKYHSAPSTLKVSINLIKSPQFENNNAIHQFKKSHLKHFQKSSNPISFYQSNGFVGGCPLGLYYDDYFWLDCVNGFNWWVGYLYPVFVIGFIIFTIVSVIWFFSCLKNNNLPKNNSTIPPNNTILPISTQTASQKTVTYVPDKNMTAIKDRIINTASGPPKKYK